jgi:hypothetical protein
MLSLIPSGSIPTLYGTPQPALLESLFMHHNLHVANASVRNLTADIPSIPAMITPITVAAHRNVNVISAVCTITAVCLANATTFVTLPGGIDVIIISEQIINPCHCILLRPSYAPFDALNTAPNFANTQTSIYPCNLASSVFDTMSKNRRFCAQSSSPVTLALSAAPSVAL